MNGDKVQRQPPSSLRQLFLWHSIMQENDDENLKPNEDGRRAMSACLEGRGYSVR